MNMKLIINNYWKIIKMHKRLQKLLILSWQDGLYSDFIAATEVTVFKASFGDTKQ